MKKYFSLVCFAVALMGCDQQTMIPDGKIPEQFLSLVQPYVGTYQGLFPSGATQLTLGLDASNKLILSSDADMISPECLSTIGNLNSVYSTGQGSDLKVTGAGFDFDPNLCSRRVLARTITLVLVQGNPVALDVNFLDRYDSQYPCGPNGEPPYIGVIGGMPGQYCSGGVPYYERGRFTKVN